MLVNVYPCAVRSIAGDVDTRVNSSNGAPRKRWVLDISGPFCFWPRRGLKSLSSGTELSILAGSVSSLLALPTTSIQHTQLVGEILVQVPPAYLDRVIQKVYRKETGL